jgi:hypothetical protein
MLMLKFAAITESKQYEVQNRDQRVTNYINGMGSGLVSNRYYLNSILLSQIQNSRKFIEKESNENILFVTGTTTTTRYDTLKRYYKSQYLTIENIRYGLLWLHTLSMSGNCLMKMP